MWDLVATSGEVADCNQLSIQALTLPQTSNETSEKEKALSGVEVFSLSFLSCRSVEVHHGELCRRRPAPSVDIKLTLSQ